MEVASSTKVREDTSRCVSETMEEFGYSARRRAIRVAGWDKWSVVKTLSTRKILQNGNIDKVFIGSCSEGIALKYESDQDIMQVNNAVKCQDQLNTEEAGDAIVFQLVRENAPAGYTFLRFVTGEKNAYMKVIRPAIVERKDGGYLSNEEFIKINEDVFYQNKGHIGRDTVYKDRNGPSIPKYVKQDIYVKILQKILSVPLNFDMDFVKAFRCSCPYLLQSWCTQTRAGDWPREETINQVSNTQIYVVPVGEKGSKNEDLQWRLSFVPAEICLVRSLNDTQTYVLILLRKIAQHLLAPICGELTSYIMKNVVFWLAESHQIESFQEKFLLDRLEEALLLLKSCVQHKTLGCYMFPERNLLQGKLSDDDQKAVVLEIDRIKENCADFILQVMECEDLEVQHPTLNKVLTTLSMLNVYDATSMLTTNTLSMKELEEYNTLMFHTSSGLLAQLYHIYHIVRPFWTKYKFGMLKDFDVFKELEAIDTCNKQVPTMSVTDEPSISKSSESISDIPAENMPQESTSLTESTPSEGTSPKQKRVDALPRPKPNTECKKVSIPTHFKRKNKKKSHRRKRPVWQARNSTGNQHERCIHRRINISFSEEDEKEYIAMFLTFLFSFRVWLYKFIKVDFDILKFILSFVTIISLWLYEGSVANQIMPITYPGSTAACARRL